MSARIAQLPAPVLACVLAIRNAWPAANISPSANGTIIQIPTRPGESVRAIVSQGDGGVWLQMPYGLPNGSAKYPTAAALVEGLRGAIERVG